MSNAVYAVQEWLQAHFPDRAFRVMNRVRAMRGGKGADLIRQRFSKTVDRLGMTGFSGRFERLDF